MAKEKNKEKKLYRVALLVCVIGALGIVLSGCSTAPLGQTPEKIKEAFLEEAIMQNGVAGNAYLNDSEYELTEFSVENIEEVTKGVEVDGDFTATIENANFVSEMSGVAKYSQVSGSDGGYYLFDIQSYDTTPKKGIDFDESKKLENVESVLSEDGKNCSVEVVKDYEFWFVDSQIKNVYTYEFTGQSGWKYTGNDKQHTTVYKNIDGGYAANSGDLTDLAAFEISNLDSTKGTFDIAYSAKETSIPIGLSRTRTYPEIHGTLTAAINPDNRGDNILEDGYSYFFTAKGATNQGSDKPVEIEGYFVIDGGNQMAIEITKFSQTTSYASEYSGDTRTENSAMGTGTLFKQ